jgi:D-alanine-D-alanine ligase-like ATP-grasp enzyme
VSQGAATLASQIQVFVRSLRLDFGSLDAVVDDEERYYIIDVNTTPSRRDTVASEILSFLRVGIEGLLTQ